jgi:YjbE family integral membrane protein
MAADVSFFARLVEIVWINILLSGDNAVVIAMACHHLPPRQRKWGIFLGAAPAVAVLIGCAAIITYLMAMPFLRLAGGAVLLWIAVQLLAEEQEEQAQISQGATLWAAVRIIVVADVVMSLDNVLAIAGIAKGNIALLTIGLAVSVPLVIFGSALLVSVMDRFPLLVTAGAVLIGYVAGDVAVGDPALAPWIAPHAETIGLALPLCCAALVIPAARVIAEIDARRRRGAQRPPLS